MPAAGRIALRQPATGVITKEILRVSSTSLKPGDEVRIFAINEDKSLDTGAGKLGKIFIRPKDGDDEDLLNEAFRKRNQ